MRCVSYEFMWNRNGMLVRGGGVSLRLCVLSPRNMHKTSPLLCQASYFIFVHVNLVCARERDVQSLNSGSVLSCVAH